MTSVEIALFLYAASIIILIIAGIIIMSFVIPLQTKEAGVKNGLAFLRRQLLAKEYLALSTIVLAIICLTIRWIVTDLDIARIVISVAVLVFSLSLLGKALIDYKIWHQSYTTANKMLHEKYEAIENARRKKLDKTAEKGVK